MTPKKVFKVTLDLDSDQVERILSIFIYPGGECSQEYEEISRQYKAQKEENDMALARKEQESEARKGQLTLGELSDKLKEMPRDADVRMLVGGVDFAVGNLNSYRGRYDELALAPVYSAVRYSVSMLLGDLQYAVRRAFRGYKGGDYFMCADTPMWASSYGESSEDMIVGVEYVNDGLVNILTRKYG